VEHTFDKEYWERHWQEFGGQDRSPEANPYLSREIGDLAPGSALDAGCGEGAEAIWLAMAGWQVTAVDISTAALARAAEREADRSPAVDIDWVPADLSVWEPNRQFDLVMTHYAHPAIPQLSFYERIAKWVAPGGTLLIVGHLHHHGTNDGHGHADERQPPAEATVTAEAVTALLDTSAWDLVTADEMARPMGGGRTDELHDVIVRATRRH
jgi:SAM-dependent methyltransferase